MQNKVKTAFIALMVALATSVVTASTHAQVKRTPPSPVVIGSASGTYTYKPGQARDDRKIIKLKAEGFLFGEVVVKFNIGSECGGSVAFWNEQRKSVFSGAYFVAPGQSAEIRDNLGRFKRTITKNTVTYEIDMAVEFGGTRFMAKECSNSYSYAAQLENYHRYIAPKPYPGKLGTSDYYNFRYRESIERHPGVGPAGYYKDFGEKYFNRFMTETYPNLSPKGQEFITRVGIGLQQAIEDKLKENPVEFAFLELNNLNFTRFAFQTHVAVYCNSGWGNLDNADRNTIKSAVNKIDLFMDKYDRITFGRAWVGIITGAQIDTCAGIKLPLKT